jgi:hypothetical protein
MSIIILLILSLTYGWFGGKAYHAIILFCLYLAYIESRGKRNI